MLESGILTLAPIFSLNLPFYEASRVMISTDEHPRAILEPAPDGNHTIPPGLR